MASNDFIIKIVLDAQSKIAPVMAAAAAEAKKLEASFEKVDRAAGSLDKKLTQLEGHVSKARDTFRSINPTLDAFDRKLKDASSTMTSINRNFNTLERNSAKAGAALGALGGIVEKLDKKLSELDRKMTEMGARTYSPKVEVDGVTESKATIDSLSLRLIALEKQKHTVRVGVERELLLKDIREVEDLLDGLGDPGIDRYIRLKLEIEGDDLARRLLEKEKYSKLFLEETRKELDADRALRDAAEQEEIDRDADAEARRHDRAEKEKAAAQVAGQAAKRDLEQRRAERLRNEELQKQQDEKRYQEIDREVKDALARQAQIRDQARARDDRAEAAHQANIRRRVQSAGDRVVRADANLQDDGRSFRDLNIDKAEAARAREVLRQELKSAGIDIPVGVKLSAADRALFEAQLRALGAREVHIRALLDVDRNQASNLGTRIGTLFMNGFNRSTRNGGSGGGGPLAFLSPGALRTAALRAAFLFSEPLLSALTGVAGGLIAVGSAAGVAATGLAGMATAATAQAIPVLGLLGVAIARVAAVTKVAQLAQAERDKGAQQAASLENTRANAADALTAAQQGVKNALQGVSDAERGVIDAQLAVVDAQRGVTDAQNQLNEARRDGIRTLEDMAMAERRSQLSAEQSQIALALRTAMGGTSLVQSAQLQAESDTRDASRARVDNRRAQAGGVEGLPGVVSAKRGVEDARKGVDDAIRGVESARRAVAQAAQGVTNARRQVEQAQRGLDLASEKMGAAASAYAIALAKLSDGEKVLLDSIERFKKLFDKAGELRGISDIIVESFARGLDKVGKLLQDNKVLASFRGLAEGIAKAFDNLATFLTTGPMRKALRFFSDEGAKNVQVFERALESVITILTNIGIAASGAFSTGLNDTAGFLERIAKTTSTKEWQKGASEFFTNALGVIKDFLHLGGAIIELFAAIAGPGGASDEGAAGIRRLTDTIRGATAYVRAHGKEVRQFFKDSIDVTSDVLSVIVSIGQAMVRTFDPRTVNGLATFIKQTVIPALASLVAILGFINRALFALFNNETVSQITKWVASFVLLRAIGLGVLAMLGRFIAWAATSSVVWLAVQAITLAFKGLRIALSALATGNPLAWIALGVAALVALYLKFEGFRKVVDGVVGYVREHWKMLLTILTGPFGIFLVAMSKLGPKLISALTGPFNDLKSWLSGLGIFDPLQGAFKKLKGWADDAAGYIGKALGGVKNFLGIGGKNDFDRAIEKAQQLKKEADAAKDSSDRAASAAVAAASYSMLGRTRQATEAAESFRNLKPGDLGQGPKKSKVPKLDDFSVMESRISPEEAKEIKKLWKDIVASTDESAKRIAKIVRDMRVSIETTLDRLTRVSKTDFHDIWESGRKNFANLDNSIEHSMGKIKTTIVDAMADIAGAFYDGFKYIVTTTNESLKAFDATPAKIAVSAPRVEKKADGGWIGQMGERGKDTIHTVLGRGEAVLNATQQRVVEPALNAMYGFGLGDMFKRTRGYHAGGAEQPGFASGGLSGPFGSGAAFTPIANFAKSKFGLTMTSGRTNHGVNTASGNVSDHSWGGAGDFSNGILTPQEDAFNAFWKKKLPQAVKQLIWRNADQFNGAFVSGHEDHVHLAVKRELAMDAARMAKLLSRASKGLSVDSLLAGIEGGGATEMTVDHVDMPEVKPKKGNRSALLSGAIKKIVAGANKYIDKQAGVDRGNATTGASHYEGALDRSFPKHSLSQSRGKVQLTPDQVVEIAQGAGLPGRTFEQIAHGESNYYPGVIGDDAAAGYGNTFGYGLWQITPLAQGPEAWKAYARIAGASSPEAMKGPHPAYFNPVKNSLMAKFLYDQAGGSIKPWYGTRFVNKAVGGLMKMAGGGHAGCAHCGGNHPTFAHGGIVGGMDWGGFQATGGDYVVNKPTMFVAGDKGRERATFTPLRAAKGKAPELADYTARGDSVSGGELAALTKQLLGSPKKMKDRAGDIVDLLDSFTRDRLMELRDTLANAVAGTKEKSKIRQALADLQEAVQKYLTDPLTILKAGLQRFTGLTNVTGVRTILGEVGDAVDKIGSQIRILAGNQTKKSADKLNDSLTKMGKALDFISGEEGPLALLEQQITNRTAKSARDLVKRQFKVDARGGSRRSVLTENAVAGQEIRDLVDTRTSLTGEASELTRLTRQAQAGLRQARTPEQIQLFRGVLSNLAQRRAGVADQIAANAQSLVERRESRASAQLDDANAKFDKRRGVGSIVKDRVGSFVSLGIEGMRRLNTARGAGPEAEIPLLDQSANIAREQIKDLTKRMQAAKKSGNRDLVKKIEEQIVELSLSIEELAQQKLAAVVNAITTDSNNKSTNIERRARIGEMLGRDPTAKNQDLIGVYNEELSKLSQVDTRGNQALNAQVVTRIEELQNSIMELTLASLDAAVNSVNTNAEKSVAAVERSTRVNELLGLGNKQTKNQSLTGIYQSQINELKAIDTSINPVLAEQTRIKIEELQNTIAELAIDSLQDQIETVNKNAEKAVSSLQRRDRLKEILGTSSKQDTNANLTSIYQQQIEALQKIDTTGNLTLTEANQTKIEELQIAIAELAASTLQAGIDDVNKAAEKREAAFGLRGRLADLRSRAGDALGGLRDRGALAADQVSSSIERRDGLAAQLQKALAAGNVGVADTLTAQIADLEVTIKEQIQTLKDNTFQVRKLSVDIINGQTNRTTGLLGSVQTIRNSLATAAGGAPADTLSVLQSIKAALTTAAGSLASQAQAAAGAGEFGAQGSSILSQLVAAFTQGPSSFTSTLQQLAPIIAAFEATLGPEGLSAFQAIVDSLVGNTVAITDNTAAIAGLNGAVTQTFTSTAWQTFRQAIFDGNGGLLPQYDTAQAMTAQATISAGFQGAAGGNNIASRMSSISSSTQTDSSIGEVNVNITNPTETADPSYIGKRVAWEIASSGRM